MNQSGAAASDRETHFGGPSMRSLLRFFAVAAAALLALGGPARADVMSGEVEYNGNLSNIGPSGWYRDGQTCGAQGEMRAVECIRVKLVGSLRQYYRLEYKALIQKGGWGPWVTDGQ